jgi:hypothetical protein
MKTYQRPVLRAAGFFTEDTGIGGFVYDEDWLNLPTWSW